MSDFKVGNDSGDDLSGSQHDSVGDGKGTGDNNGEGDGDGKSDDDGNRNGHGNAEGNCNQWKIPSYMS